MASKTVLLVGVVIIVILVGAAAYYVFSSSSSGNSTTIGITIMGDGRDFYTPANVTVRLNQHVTLAVFNDDDNPHGLAIAAFNVTTGSIAPSQAFRVSFVASQPGTFEFYSPVELTNATGVQDLQGYLMVQP